MIAVRIEGRLGNQLFQYAFIYCLSKKIKASFYIDKSIEKYLLPEYFYIKKDPLEKWIFTIKGYKNIFTHHLRKIYYDNLKKVLFLKNQDFSNDISPEDQLKNATDNVAYTGFFQSEKYFYDIRTDVHRLFRIKKQYQTEFNQIFNSLPNKSSIVTVHIRRGDYVYLGINLQMDYYHNAIKTIHSDSNFYVLISDDPEFVEREFSYLNKKYVSKNPEIVDFQFLINANCCILSNSSFSWWGGYLNKNNAKILVPQKWSVEKNKQETPIDIIPDNWIRISHG